MKLPFLKKKTKLQETEIIYINTIRLSHFVQTGQLMNVDHAIGVLDLFRREIASSKKKLTNKEVTALYARRSTKPNDQGSLD